MGLQRGNVDVNKGKAPDPWLKITEFREQFTEDHRRELQRAVQAYYESMRKTPQGEVDQDAHDATLTARTALQLIAGIHPPPYEW